MDNNTYFVGVADYSLQPPVAIGPHFEVLIGFFSSIVFLLGVIAAAIQFRGKNRHTTQDSFEPEMYPLYTCRDNEIPNVKISTGKCVKYDNIISKLVLFSFCIHIIN